MKTMLLCTITAWATSFLSLCNIAKWYERRTVFLQQPLSYKAKVSVGLSKCMYTITRRALGGAHVPPTQLFPRFAGAQYLYVGFPDVIKFRVATHTKAIQFRHPDYNSDRAQKLISSSTSRHLSTRNISSKSMHAFLSNLANRQTDKRTRANAFTSSFVGGNNDSLNLQSTTAETAFCSFVMSSNDRETLSGQSCVHFRINVSRLNHSAARLAVLLLLTLICLQTVVENSSSCQDGQTNYSCG